MERLTPATRGLMIYADGLITVRQSPVIPHPSFDIAHLPFGFGARAHEEPGRYRAPVLTSSSLFLGFAKDNADARTDNNQQCVFGRERVTHASELKLISAEGAQ